MPLTIELSSEVERDLRSAFGDNLDRAALEALAIEGYRGRKIGVGQVRRMLGFPSRSAAEEWLGTHGVALAYDADDLEADRQTLTRLLGPAK